MTKSCLTCKYEPDWKSFDERHHNFGIVFEAGKCKFPMPPNNTPFIGKDDKSLGLKYQEGDLVVDMIATRECYAWEPK